MTRKLSESIWAKTTLVLLVVVTLASLWAYLASGIFMVAFGHRFEDATPITLYQYWFHHGTQPAVRQWIWIASGVATALVVAPFLLFLSPTKRSLFGDARFATMREITKAGLLGDAGLVVGRIGNWFSGHRYLLFGGAQHAIISAPTRSGKGVGIVIPNLLQWPHSVVVLDVKQENFDITSGYRRKHGQACYLFNPAATDYRTHRYNPLAYVSQDPNFRIDDVQKIANMLFPDQPGTDVIWTATPRSLFLGIVLYLLETPGKPATLGQVLRETLTDGDGSQYFASIINLRALGARIRQTAAADAVRLAEGNLTAVLADKGKAPEHHPLIAEMAIWYACNDTYRKAVIEQWNAATHANSKTPDIPSLLENTEFDRATVEVGKALSNACVLALNSYISIAAENTRAGIIGGFRSRLELWMNPLVDAATSGNDFDLRDVRKRRMSVYLGATPDNLDRLAPLYNLFFQQLIDLNTRDLPERNPDIKHPCLLLMDEFTAIGKIPILAKGISYIAGYWLRMMPIIQSPAQIIEVYGKDAAQTFTTNHALQIIYPPKATETQTAEDISKWLGYQTVKGRSHSKGRGLFSKKTESENISDQRRALLLPQEITGLGQDKELVILENTPPIEARKVSYYQDPEFINRLKTVSPRLRSLGRAIPQKSQLEEAIKSGELAAPVPRIELSVAPATSQLCSVIPPAQGGKKQSIIIERPVTAEDVPNLTALSLANFAVDFSSSAKPAGELDEAALHAYADNLCRLAGINV